MGTLCCVVGSGITQPHEFGLAHCCFVQAGLALQNWVILLEHLLRLLFRFSVFKHLRRYYCCWLALLPTCLGVFF